MEQVEVYVVVMDYATSSLRQYLAVLDDDYDDDDVIEWLCYHDDCFELDTCYYMCSNKPIILENNFLIN